MHLVLVFLLPTAYSQLPPASFNHLKRDELLRSYGYHCLAEDRFGFIWFGSWYGGGLYRFDGYDLKSFVVDPNKSQATLPSNMINTVTRYGNDQLCIGTHEGMTVLDIITGEMKNYNDNHNDGSTFYPFYVEPIVPDSMHRCTWIGSSFGLHRLRWPRDSIEFILDKQSNRSVPKLEKVIDLVLDNRNPEMLWIGTESGLFSYRIDRNEIRYYSSLVYSGVILDLYQDSSGILWMGVDDITGDLPPAVVRFSTGDNTWKRYDLKEGNISPSEKFSGVFFILPSLQKDKLWVSTHGRVGLFDINNGEFQAWYHNSQQPDGLLQNGFYRSMLADRHGRLWITSWDGIQYAKKAFAVPGNHISRAAVCITDIQVSNSPDDTIKPLLYHGTLELQKNQRDVSFRYVLPNPLNPSAVTYQYMLDGHNDEWITTDQRIAQYTDLKGGSYRFMIRAKEGSAEWSAVRELPVSIDKKVTEYIWFWIVAIILLATALIGVNRYFIMRTKKQAAIKAEYDRKVSEIEMQALRAQMNPHFLFNSLNSIKYYAISKDKDATAEYLSKFAMLVRTILNNSKSRTISLRDELEALRLYIEIEYIRLEGKFEYEINIDSSLKVEQAQIPPMVLQPYVENAIWHGLMHRNGGGKLKVEAKYIGGHVQCIIEDNGIGRERAKSMKDGHHSHKQSLGMKITADRIGLINKIYNIDTQVHVVDLYDDAGVPSGTRVVINIPIIEDVENQPIAK